MNKKTKKMVFNLSVIFVLLLASDGSVRVLSIWVT